jgi:hypothetical protein
LLLVGQLLVYWQGLGWDWWPSWLLSSSCPDPPKPPWLAGTAGVSREQGLLALLLLRQRLISNAEQ